MCKYHKTDLQREMRSYLEGRMVGMTYEEYQQKKNRQLVAAFMKANGWNEDEYEIK